MDEMVEDRVILEGIVNDIVTNEIKMGKIEMRSKYLYFLGIWEMFKIDGSGNLFTETFKFSKEYADEIWREDSDIIFIPGLRLAGKPVTLRKIYKLEELRYNVEFKQDISFYDQLEYYQVFISKGKLDNLNRIERFAELIIDKNNLPKLDIIECTVNDFLVDETNISNLNI